jgi:hypothetical protein
MLQGALERACFFLGLDKHPEKHLREYHIITSYVIGARKIT